MKLKLKLLFIFLLVSILINFISIYLLRINVKNKINIITINLICDIIQYVIFCNKNIFNKIILKYLLCNYLKMIMFIKYI